MTELQSRLPVWKALSGFYLDTELWKTDYQYIYKTLANSGKSLKELKEIDLYEVFPTLQGNLDSVAGEWAGFDEKWMEKKCIKNYKRKSNPFFRIIVKFRNRNSYSMRKRHWKVIEEMYYNYFT